jgi:hypothetical protein
MLRFLLAPSLALAFAAAPLTVEAKPGGCLKYGAAGAVAGHMAGHGVVGAVAGCALGVHKRREYKREMRMQQQSGAPTMQRSVAPAAQQGTY